VLDDHRATGRNVERDHVELAAEPESPRLGASGRGFTSGARNSPSTAMTWYFGVSSIQRPW
jgi:hypothetical protein